MSLRDAADRNLRRSLPFNKDATFRQEGGRKTQPFNKDASFREVGDRPHGFMTAVKNARGRGAGKGPADWSRRK